MHGIDRPLGRLLDRQVRESVQLRADWPAPARVRAFTTLRRGLAVGESLPPFDAFNLGARCGDDPAAVAHNRAALGWVGELPAPPHWLRQVHGTGVARIAHPEPASAEEPVADAAVTDVAGVVLAILTADCLPVLFCAADGGEVGAAHAGWRGLAAGVLEHTVAAMHTPAAGLLAWLGPAAGPAAYEVGEEVRAAFVDIDAGAAAAFAPTRPGHFLCDLYALARRRLGALGVARVSGGQHCTIRDAARFYSHRRDGRSGRMASLIWIAASA
jgi:polyphenol oxidase